MNREILKSVRRAINEGNECIIVFKVEVICVEINLQKKLTIIICFRFFLSRKKQKKSNLCFLFFSKPIPTIVSVINLPNGSDP